MTVRSPDLWLLLLSCDLDLRTGFEIGVRPDDDPELFDDPFELEVTLDTDLCRPLANPEATLSRYSDRNPWSLSTNVSCMRSEKKDGRVDLIPLLLSFKHCFTAH